MCLYVAIANKILERDTLCIVERHATLELDHLFNLFGSHTFDLGGCLNDLSDLLILLCKDAIKTADDRHRNNYVTVFFGGARICTDGPVFEAKEVEI